jgi:putative flippase GtrA
VVPNAKYDLKIAIIIAFEIAIINIYNCNLRLKFEKLPQPKHGSTYALINATRVSLFLKVIDFLLFSHNFIQPNLSTPSSISGWPHHLNPKSQLLKIAKTQKP